MARFNKDIAFERTNRVLFGLVFLVLIIVPALADGI